MVKGRYVGQLEINFEIDLEKIGKVTFDEFKENFQSWNEEIYAILEPYIVEDTEGCKADLTLTQQYMDIYESREESE